MTNKYISYVKFDYANVDFCTHMVENITYTVGKLKLSIKNKYYKFTNK